MSPEQRPDRDASGKPPDPNTALSSPSFMAWLYLLLSAAAYAAANVVLIRAILPPRTVAPRWRTPALVGFLLLTVASVGFVVIWSRTEPSAAEVMAIFVLFVPQFLFLGFILRQDEGRVQSGRTD
jgi:hypothetical protein